MSAWLGLDCTVGSGFTNHSVASSAVDLSSEVSSFSLSDWFSEFSVPTPSSPSSAFRSIPLSSVCPSFPGGSIGAFMSIFSEWSSATTILVDCHTNIIQFNSNKEVWCNFPFLLHIVLRIYTPLTSNSNLLCTHNLCRAILPLEFS